MKKNIFKHGVHNTSILIKSYIITNGSTDIYLQETMVYPSQADLVECYNIQAQIHSTDLNPGPLQEVFFSIRTLRVKYAASDDF